MCQPLHSSLVPPYLSKEVDPDRGSAASFPSYLLFEEEEGPEMAAATYLDLCSHEEEAAAQIQVSSSWGWLRCRCHSCCILTWSKERGLDIAYPQTWIAVFSRRWQQPQGRCRDCLLLLVSVPHQIDISFGLKGLQSQAGSDRGLRVMWQSLKGYFNFSVYLRGLTKFKLSAVFISIELWAQHMSQDSQGWLKLWEMSGHQALNMVASLWRGAYWRSAFTTGL